MTPYNWMSHLKLHIVILRFMGLWPKNETYKFDPYIVRTVILFSLFILCHDFSQAVNLYFIRHNLSALVGTSYILLIKLLSFFKGYYLMKNMKLLHEIVEILNDDMFQPVNIRHQSILKSRLNFWSVCKKIFIATCYGSNTFFAMYPLIDQTSEERRLPFLAWYPFDSKSSPNYEITYVYQVLAVVYNTSVHVNVDALSYVFNMFACVQFDFLGENLRKVADCDENSPGEIYTKLLKCVQHHKLILEYVRKCNNFFNWIVLLQFFVSAVSIGITMFQLTLVAPFSTQYNSLIIYFAAITVQIFLYCWFGDSVQEASSNVPYAVFESNWIHLPPKLKKMMIFFTLQLLKPVRLSALDLFYLTLDTFMRIMKTAYSYFAFLHQMSSRK